MPADAARALTVAEALLSRRSVRAFLPTPVPRETVERILALASRAPSGTNMQPWAVHVVAGAAKEALCAEVLAAFDSGDPGEPEWQYYPDPFFRTLSLAPAQDRLGSVQAAWHHARRQGTHARPARAQLPLL